MIKKISAYLLSYIMTFFAALIFITCVGYYTFFFDWDISAIAIAINAVLIILAIAASIALYGLAEKIKDFT